MLSQRYENIFYHLYPQMIKNKDLEYYKTKKENHRIYAAEWYRNKSKETKIQKAIQLLRDNDFYVIHNKFIKGAIK